MPWRTNLAAEPGTPPENWSPTKKWWASFTGSVAAIVASWVVTGQFDDVERGMAATAIVSLTAAYWTRNDQAQASGVTPEA